MYEGDPKNTRIFLLKYLCIYSYMFKLQSPSKYSPFDAIHLLRHFFHCSKQFLNLSILIPFSASAIFCFSSSTSTKLFPLRIFFIWENKKKVTWDKIGWIGRWGTGVMPFLVKNAGHSAQKHWTLSTVWASALINHPSCNGQMLKSLQKKIHWGWAQPLTTRPAGTVIQMGS